MAGAAGDGEVKRDGDAVSVIFLLVVVLALLVGLSVGATLEKYFAERLDQAAKRLEGK